MGFSSGKSKAKREARKKAQAAYFKAISGAERIKPLRSIDTDSARKLEDEIGDGLSYGSKRLAMQADKLARKINTDTDFKDRIENYNKRYDEIKRQMNGETIKKFEVVENNDSPFSNIAKFGLNVRSQSGVDNFDSFEQAQKEAFTRVKPKERTPGLLSFASNKVPFMDAGKAKQPDFKVNEVTLGAINSNYRSLPQTQGAYNDLETLSKNISSSPVNKFAESYELLAQKLKGRLKREIDTAPKQNLNSPDILTGAPAQEVIR